MIWTYYLIWLFIFISTYLKKPDYQSIRVIYLNRPKQERRMIMSEHVIALWVALIAFYFFCGYDLRKLAARIESNKEKLETTIAEMKGE